MDTPRVSRREYLGLVICEAGNGSELDAGLANTLFMRGLIAADRTLTAEGIAAVEDIRRRAKLVRAVQEQFGRR